MKLIFILCAAILCCGAAVAPADEWCRDADVLRVEVDGADVTIYHDAALYNCCPDPFQYDMAWEANTLVVTETEILTNPCFCICCFDLNTTIEDVPAGQWTLRLRWFDYEALDWIYLEAPLVVGDVGQSGQTVQGASVASDCLDATEADIDDWGRVQTLYR